MFDALRENPYLTRWTSHIEAIRSGSRSPASPSLGESNLGSRSPTYTASRIVSEAIVPQSFAFNISSYERGFVIKNLPMFGYTLHLPGV